MQTWAGDKVKGEEIFPRLAAAFKERDALAEDDIEASRAIITAATRGGGLFQR